MQLHDLQRTHKNKGGKRVGRGGDRGKTSGRGTKGQKARAGHRIRPEMRDTIKKLPKKRGTGKNRARSVNALRVRPVVVNLAALQSAYVDNDTVNPTTLREKKLARKKKGMNMSVKILGTGELTRKLSVERCLVSESAREKIEKAGGTVTQ